MNARQPRGGLIDELKRQYRRRPKPIWMVITADVLLIALSLVVFALFHHVLPRQQASLGLVSSRDSSDQNRGAIAAVSDDTDGGETGEAVSFNLDAISGDDLSFSDDGSEGDDGAEAPDTEGTGAEADAAVPDATDTGAEFADDAVGEPDQEPEEEASFEGRNADGQYAGIPGNFADKFADKFSDGRVTKSSSGYQSANVNITLKRYKADAVFYVADIYIRDISCLVTAFAQGRYGMGLRNWTGNMNTELGGIIAINGDYYGGREDGIVIRNGELYRADDFPTRDVCVLFWDGSMETYGRGKFNAQAAIESGAYQAWNFGPRLLDENGRAKTRFNSDVGSANPRTALGYYEPGHYCFVVVDGRSKKSGGMTLTELAALMQDLGCVRAYNMDGGNTSVMVVGKKSVNNPSGGGRPTTDIIAIVDK